MPTVAGPRPPTLRLRAQGGFTLLEVLVAFIIAALGVAALLQGAAAGLQGAQSAAHYQEAVSRAQSRLAALSAGLPVGDRSGDDGGGFRWSTSVQAASTLPLPPSQPVSAGAERLVLYAVTVGVSWQTDGRQRQVALSTQRLGIAAAVSP